MCVHYAIAWRDGDGTRFVGRLALLPSHLQLEGTSTAVDREHGLLRIDRRDIKHASVERRGELSAVCIQTAEDSRTLEMLTGGRGMALALLDDLSE